jgi:predicted nucleotidyltransferase
MSTPIYRLSIDRFSLADFYRRHHIHRLSLFGSVLGDDFGPDSDVDVLVDYEPGHAPGWEVVDIEDELGRLFGGRKIDLVNRKYLTPRLRDRILATEVLQYEDNGGERRIDR